MADNEHASQPATDEEEYEGGGGGRWIIAIGALLLVGAMFLTWFHVVYPNNFAEDTTGWQTFVKLRWFLLAAGIGALASVALVPTRPVQMARIAVSLAATALIIRHIVSPPDLGRTTVSVQLGIYISLLGALGILFGALLDREEEEEAEEPGRPTETAAQLGPGAGAVASAEPRALEAPTEERRL